MSMDMNRVNIRTRDGQKGFIQMNYRALCENALTGFRAHGRGVILVEVEQHNPDLELVPYDFLPRAGLAKILDDLDTAHEGQLIRDYNPETELVIVFAWEEGKRTNFDSYRVRQG